MIEAKRALLPSVVLEGLTHHHSTFTPAQLARAATDATASPKEFSVLMAAILASPDLVRLDDGHGRVRYTTRAQKAAEEHLAETAARMAGGLAHGVTTVALTNALQRFTGPEQAGTREALHHLLDERGLSIVVGYAGAGKSTLLRSAADAWKSSGYQPRGLALAGRAAEGLEADAGISAGTIAAFLYGLERGTVRLTATDILVVDEAGMVGSRQMDRIMDAARTAGAKVVLVGDPEQLQAIEAGGAFRYLVDNYDHARLATVWRQRSDWMREATRNLAEAGTASALDAYEANGMVHAHADTKTAVTALLDQWQAGRDLGGSQLILTATNADARAINMAARERLRGMGVLGADHDFVTEDGPVSFAKGDRVLFRKNDKGLGVKNGTTGTVVMVEDDAMTVAIDGKPLRTLRVVLSTYEHLSHGYAVTIHKSQGATVDRTYVLASPNMDRHATYVALSRHRDRVSMHWARDQFVDRLDFGRRLARARLKDLTLDYEGSLAAAQAEARQSANAADSSETQLWSRLYEEQRAELVSVATMSAIRRAFWYAANLGRFASTGSMTLARLHERERGKLAATLQQARRDRRNAPVVQVDAEAALRREFPRRPWDAEVSAPAHAPLRSPRTSTRPGPGA